MNYFVYLVGFICGATASMIMMLIMVTIYDKPADKQPQCIYNTNSDIANYNRTR